MIKRYSLLISSLRVTIACFLTTALLLLIMSIAQIENGPTGASDKYIYSLFAYWNIESVDMLIPFFPGGYLIALVLSINLLLATYFEFKLKAKSIGLCLIYISVVILIAGDLISQQNRYTSTMTLSQGEKTHFTLSTDEFELAVKDINAPEHDKVYAIPEVMLERRQTIRHPDLPFQISISAYFENSIIDKQVQTTDDVSLLANQGFGKGVSILPIRPFTEAGRTNTPSALVTLFTPQKAIGSWLVRSEWDEQQFNYNGRRYTLELRPKHYNHPFELELVKQSLPAPGSTNKSRSASMTLTEQTFVREITLTPERPFFYNGLSFHLGKQSENSVQISAIKNPAKALPYWALLIGLLGCGTLIVSNVSLRLKSNIKK